MLLSLLNRKQADRTDLSLARPIVKRGKSLSPKLEKKSFREELLVLKRVITHDPRGPMTSEEIKPIEKEQPAEKMKVKTKEKTSSLKQVFQGKKPREDASFF